MDTDKQIAIKGAELFGYEIVFRNTSASDTVVCVIDNELMDFSPANDANDMNKLIEALQLDVTWNTGIWTAGNFDVFARDESRDEAIRECVIKALGLHKDSEALGVENDKNH